MYFTEYSVGGVFIDNIERSYPELVLGKASSDEIEAFFAGYF
jgi:hypothetical protein